MKVYGFDYVDHKNMKLVDLEDESFFVVLNSRKLKGLFFKLYFNEKCNVVVCDKAPFFDKPFWLSPFLEIKKVEGVCI